MGIRSRIFLIVFLLLTVSIAITYVVAERDLTRTFKLQIVDELEKQANLLVASVDNLNKFSNINDADNAANELPQPSRTLLHSLSKNLI
jgi:two-component system phosphate regulon sensor histidine kinase PhoR